MKRKREHPPSLRYIPRRRASQEIDSNTGGTRFYEERQELLKVNLAILLSQYGVRVSDAAYDVDLVECSEWVLEIEERLFPLTYNVQPNCGDLNRYEMLTVGVTRLDGDCHAVVAFVDHLDKRVEMYDSSGGCLSMYGPLEESVWKGYSMYRMNDEHLQVQQ